jgi:hypothetical protein
MNVDHEEAAAAAAAVVVVVVAVGDDYIARVKENMNKKRKDKKEGAMNKSTIRSIERTDEDGTSREGEAAEE